MEIVKHPNELLKEVSSEVEYINSETIEILKEMEKTMKEKNGIGLAAIQIGIKQRMFVMREKEEVLFFINPKITMLSKEKDSYEEGCLSVPNVFVEILRPLSLQIKFIDIHGKQRKEEFKGLSARIIQHEFDHLEGILFFEKLKKSQQNILLKKYFEIMKEKHENIVCRD